MRKFTFRLIKQDFDSLPLAASSSSSKIYSTANYPNFNGTRNYRTYILGIKNTNRRDIEHFFPLLVSRIKFNGSPPDRSSCGTDD